MKKRFTLLLVTLMATSAFAQSPYQSIEDKGNSYVNVRQERVINKNVRFADAPTVLAPKHENPTELDPSLFVQPEGELQLMRRSGIDYLPVWGSPAPADYTEKGTYIVKGTDGNYYFKNFVTNMCNGGTWIKGDVEGNVISVKTGQINAQLWYDNGTTNQLYTYYLYALEGVEQTGVDWYGNEYTYMIYVPDETVTAAHGKMNEEELSDEELAITAENVDAFADDSVRLYLREIGKIPLLEEAQTQPLGLQSGALQGLRRGGQDGLGFLL